MMDLQAVADAALRELVPQVSAPCRLGPVGKFLGADAGGPVVAEKQLCASFNSQQIGRAMSNIAKEMNKYARGRVLVVFGLPLKGPYPAGEAVDESAGIRIRLTYEPDIDFFRADVLLGRK